MAYSIRVDRTDPNAQRVQVIRYANRRPVILKHIGTAHTEEELVDLKALAAAWILSNPPQPQLFEEDAAPVPRVLQEYEYRGFRFAYVYELLHRLCERFGFHIFADEILIDLVIMRIFEPASKLRSLGLLSNYFSITHSEPALYRSLRRFPKLKQSVEEKIVAVAKSEFGFDFSFVLYDVTTLYFETFKSDDLRKPGFSKDNKSQQPQIVYIVGARLGNISANLLETIDAGIEREDRKTMRTQAPHGTLVLGFSKKRYAKDMSDMNKQVEKAQRQVENPGLTRRAKFVSASGTKASLNETLIEKTKKLLGVKGYYTNLDDVSDDDVISHYHSLWHVEQAFRIAKSDIASRPIFHRKEESIKAHMLICVMALAISKYIEIKTGQSIRFVLDACKSVTDAVLVHRNTQMQTIMRSPIPEEMKDIEKLLSH